MGWFEGWPFKSKEQTEKERLDFERRVFPLGMAQREAALGVLRQVVVNRRLQDAEILFAFISAKDSYELADRAPEGLDRARGMLEKNRWLKPDDIDAVLALVRLDCLAETLADYPTAGDVRSLLQGSYGRPE